LVSPIVDEIFGFLETGQDVRRREDSSVDLLFNYLLYVSIKMYR